MTDFAIELQDVDKSYSLESRPWHRLWQQISGRTAGTHQFQALRQVKLQIRKGEVVGIIGRNGAGKSTLLQVVCGVLQPTRGERKVQGRIAALLELGAGFNPELTGRENVRLNGPLLGLSSTQIDALLPSIIEFASIGEFIDQPVRSYSSGMFVRLAFAMATSVEPEILVIDEALSVGDDAFARKSFARIMALKDKGVTILFCSHSLFQVESLCQRALWLHNGQVAFDGPAAQAVVEYKTWSDAHDSPAPQSAATPSIGYTSARAELLTVDMTPNLALLQSQQDDLGVRVSFRSDLAEPCPTLGVVIHGADLRSVASAGNWLDGLVIVRDAAGHSAVHLLFPALALLKGRFTVSVYLMCERALQVLSAAEHVLTFDVQQNNVEQGLVSLPRQWRNAD